jgi:hypothetical protein
MHGDRWHCGLAEFPPEMNLWTKQKKFLKWKIILLLNALKLHLKLLNFPNQKNISQKTNFILGINPMKPCLAPLVSYLQFAEYTKDLPATVAPTVGLEI